MAAKLTKKQTLIIDFIRDYMSTRGASPTYREIMTALGLSSVSAVAEHIDNLVKKGALKKIPGAARSLEIIDLYHPETVELFHHYLATATPEEKATLEAAAKILDLEL